MPFVPTENQVTSLHTLIKQLVREHVEIRVIRFLNYGHPKDVFNNIIEVVCLEDEDRYRIHYDGKII